MSPFVTDEKRVARLQAFSEAKRLLDIDGSIIHGKSVVLAGPDLGDVGCLKHLLHVKPSDTIFVDTDDTGLKNVSTRMPGAKIYHGDILEVLEFNKSPLSFVNLDFCGRLDDHKLRVFKNVCTNLVRGGVVVYTFYRGRESGNTRAGEIIHKLSDHPDLEVRRVHSYVKAIMGSTGDSLVPTKLVNYQSKAPMSVLIFQKITRSFTKCSDPIRSITKKSVTKDMHESVANLMSLGKRSKEISEILNLNYGSTAAIMANVTRGTYKE